MGKKIAAITMARNDHFFLQKWIEYYGREFGKQNLFIILDGEDQEIPQNAENCNIERIKRIARPRLEGDKARIKLISKKAADLLNIYDLIIGVDTDEFIIVDPGTNQSLAQYLSTLNIKSSLSALGLDVGQHLNEEAVLDKSKPILSQRNYALISSRYTKSSIISQPVEWGSGFHRVKHHNFRIDPNLYLLHIGNMDLEMLKMKMGDTQRINSGWENHLKRRSRTITKITNSNKVIDGDLVFEKARKLQSILRPVFAWNKPSMGYWNLIIRIPARFKENEI